MSKPLSRIGLSASPRCPASLIAIRPVRWPTTGGRGLRAVEELDAAADPITHAWYEGHVGKVINLYSGRDPRELPMYSIREAAAFLGVPASTLRTWVRGKAYRWRGQTRHMQRLLKSDSATGLLTFNNFVEAYVLASLTRRFEVPLVRVRQALRYLGGERPLLTTVFKTDGRGIFVEQMGALVDAARGGQRAFREIVEDSLERVDLDKASRPLRLYPWRREPDEPRTVSIDPQRAFGRPTVAGRGVKLDVIIDRHRAGETVAELSKDYALGADVIEDVLRWGLDVAAAA